MGNNSSTQQEITALQHRLERLRCAAAQPWEITVCECLIDALREELHTDDLYPQEAISRIVSLTEHLAEITPHELAKIQAWAITLLADIMNRFDYNPSPAPCDDLIVFIFRCKRHLV